MTPERWRRVGELFHQALEVASEARTAWADQTCAGDSELRRELASLLENDRAAGEGFVRGRVQAAVASFQEESSRTNQPRRAGPYRLVRELGQGGMGTVCLAERDDDQYQTQVAIKLVRPGMDTDFILHRFRRERQILAHLQHPHIARLLDGGTTADGLPYIVMEYIEGSRITDYCESRRLSVEERLRLFLDVCAAVEYAHRHFVVHRDLKPGNILVDHTGAVKLLDFGICKLLYANPLAKEDAVTEGLRLLTPDYASPEQIRGDPITVASDVYSLAAVLYELLTGAKPHRMEQYTPQAIERAICEQEVLRPSLAAKTKPLARRLSGDLDNILLRALQKDPARRYASAEQFSEDLRRHLAHQPVLARPDTMLYRLVKFAQRRRGAVMAGAAVLLSLAAGVIVSTREARVARENLRQVRRLANAFVFDVHDAVRDLPGSIRARRLIVETGLRYLDGLAGNSRGNWELQRELAAAYERIGEVQGDVMSANLGNTTAALESYRKARSLLDSIVQHDPDNRRAQADRLTVYQRMAGIHSYVRDSRQALDSLREAGKLGEALLAQHPDDAQVRKQLAEIHIAAGDVLRLSGEYAASLQENSQALALLQESAAAQPANQALQQLVSSAYSAVGMSEVRLGRLQEGLDHYRRAAAQMEQLARLEPANAAYQRDLMLVYSHLGDVLGNPNLPSLGDTAGAIEAYRRILSVARRLYEADRADQRAVHDYGIALSRVATILPEAQLAERLSLLRHSLQLLQEVARVNPQNLNNRTDLAYGYGLLGDALAASGDGAGAARNYRESLTLAETMLSSGQNSPLILQLAACRKLGEEAARRGDRETSLSFARRALEASDAPGRPAAVQRFLTPRGSAAMGLVYAGLAHSKTAPAAETREDRRQAELWLGKSLAAWREAQADPAFGPPHRREMQQVEAALAALKRP